MKSPSRIISLHIPKTGGTSLYTAFQEAFGHESTLEVSRKEAREPKKLEHAFNSNAQVIHGHFRFAEIAPLLPDEEDIKLFTFVREPIQRIVSNYQHFIARAKKARFGSTLWKRRKEDLCTYAVHPETQNKIYHFLHPFEWDRFSHIGHMENFNAEIDKIASMLSISQLNHHAKNQRKFSHELTQEEREYITSINHLDIEVYEELCQRYPR